jgi:hypothetical protein
MMRVIASALLLAAIGCSSAGTDTPPTLEVTSPARGTFAESDTVTVTGRATDAEGPVKVTVGGVEVSPAKDGSFSVAIPVAAGVDLIETHAIDNGGNDVRDVRAVLAGSLAPSDGTSPGQVGARAGVTALRAVGTAIGAAAKQIDYTAAAQALNPVYDNSGCLGAKINVTSITLTDVNVGLVPQTGILATDVTIDNLDVRLSASFKVACIGGSTTITVRANKTKIHGDLAARIANSAIATSLPGASVSFEGFSVDVGGVPGAIESLLRDEARKGVEKALTGAIKSKVPPIADKALAGLIAKPIMTSLLGADTTISIVPSQIAITPAELFVAVDSKLKIAGGEGGTFLTTAATLSPTTMAASQGLGIALDDDIVNQLFAGLWATDAFDKSIAISEIPALGAVLDDDARTIDIKMSLPPTATTDTGELVLALGDLMLTVRDDSGAEVQSIALSITTAIAAGPTQSGTMTLTVGAPTVYAQVLAQSDAVDDPLTDDQVEALVTAAWSLIGVKADDALSKLPMPTIGGVQLGAPTISTATGFVLADIGVQ